jgi:hypothetical protein
MARCGGFPTDIMASDDAHSSTNPRYDFISITEDLLSAAGGSRLSNDELTS